MPEPVDSPDYWEARLTEALPGGADAEHHSVFRCPADRWRRIEAAHRAILARLVDQVDSVLDCGCGYGRLLTLMPPGWRGRYLGVDLAPAMINEARRRFPGRAFAAADLRRLPPADQPFALAVLVSVRPMVRRNLGHPAWAEMEARVRSAARRLLYLEYDEDDPGSME